MIFVIVFYLKMGKIKRSNYGYVSNASTIMYVCNKRVM